mgnify:FL=1
MPELPEVETTMRGILPHLKEQIILKIDVLDERLRWPVSEEIQHIRNSPVVEITRRAKYILIEVADQQHIMIHLGMSGSLRICSADEPLRKHDHLVFHLSTGLQMRYHDPRRFGSVLWQAADIHQHPLLIKLGPEPLNDEFSIDYFIEKTKPRKTSIKQHIMDSHIVVGVGNIYACEALFMAGVQPTRMASKVSKPRLIQLRNAIRFVLNRSIEQGGTTLKDFLNSDGQPGYFKQQLAVYDREGQACAKCKSTVKRIVIGQRSTFYCPKCQK